MATPSLDDLLKIVGKKVPQTASRITPTVTPTSSNLRNIPNLDDLMSKLPKRGAKASTGMGGIGGLFGKALSVIDLPRSFITSGVKEMTDLFQGEGFSFRDLASQTKDHYGFGDYLREENIDLGKWGNRIAGFVGDVALDPLS